MPPHPTRRRVLAGLGGLAGITALGSACRGGRRVVDPRDIPTEIALSSEIIGHRIRDGARVEPPADAWTDVGVVIVGGGVAGLAAARALARAGRRDFLLLELEDALGGTARGGRSAVSPHPWGAHYLNLPRGENARLVQLLDEAGFLDGREPGGDPIASEAALCRDPDERVFYRGHWYEGLSPTPVQTVADVEQFTRFEAELARFGALRDARGRRAFTLPRALCSDDADFTALDRLSFAEFLDAHGFTSAPLRWQCDYACRDDFGAHLADVSAWAGLHYFVSRRDVGGHETAPVLTWPEGNARLVEHLARGVGDRIRTGLAATEVLPTETGVEVRALSVADGRAVGFRARRAILAVPQVFAGRLLRPWRDAPPPHLSHFTYSPWLVGNLELDSRPIARGFPLSWDNVPYESRALGYICATHQTGLDYGPTQLTWYDALADTEPRAARAELLGLDAAACRDRVLTELGPAHRDLAGRVRQMRFARHGHAMVRPRPGFLWSQALADAAAPYRGVHFANTDLSGLALFEEAFFHGERAAAEVVAAG